MPYTVIRLEHVHLIGTNGWAWFAPVAVDLVAEGGRAKDATGPRVGAAGCHETRLVAEREVIINMLNSLSRKQLPSLQHQHTVPGRRPFQGYYSPCTGRHYCLRGMDYYVDGAPNERRLNQLVEKIVRFGGCAGDPQLPLSGLGREQGCTEKGLCWERGGSPVQGQGLSLWGLWKPRHPGEAPASAKSESGSSVPAMGAGVAIADLDGVGVQQGLWGQGPRSHPTCQGAKGKCCARLSCPSRLARPPGQPRLRCPSQEAPRDPLWQHPGRWGTCPLGLHLPRSSMPRWWVGNGSGPLLPPSTPLPGTQTVSPIAGKGPGEAGRSGGAGRRSQTTPTPTPSCPGVPPLPLPCEGGRELTQFIAATGCTNHDRRQR